MDTLNFSSVEEELKYWKSQAAEYKERYEETREELEEFQISSQELEAELEASLEQTESKNKELVSVKARLEMEVDSLRDKLETLQLTSHKQINELETDMAQVRAHRDELVKYIRGLEQANDDLERAKRSTVTSLEDFEGRLNQAIERNAFLESELDEKEILAITVQRLKDEARDLRHEMSVKKPLSPDKEDLIKVEMKEGTKEGTKEEGVKVKEERMDTSDAAIIDSNKLAEEVSSISVKPANNIKSNIKNETGGSSPLTPSARISALNIVGDLLRKVGALETKLASCRNYVNNPQPRKTGTNSPLNSPSPNSSISWLKFPSMFKSPETIHESRGSAMDETHL